MLVDAHVHLFPDRLANAIRAWFDTHAWDIQYRVGVDECVARLQGAGVDRMVTLPYVHKPGLSRALNDFTLEVARRHPSVVPCCTVLPGEEDDERILDEALAVSHGVKIHCHVMRLAPDDPRMDVVWRASARHRKPIVIHCGREPASDRYGVDVRALSGAALLDKALSRHPDAIAIVPHLGVDEAPQFEALLSRYEHLYLDTAMVIGGYFPDQPDLDIIRRNPGRILYGTDFPNLPYDFTRELAVIRGLGLSAEDEARVLGGNAARLFGLDPRPGPLAG